MKQEHKYAQVLRWIADGENLQWDRDGACSWVSANSDQVLYAIGSGAACEPSRFRLAPRTIRVNGVEVPGPEKDAPKVGDTYYVPDFGERLQYYGHTWRDDELDLLYLERGVVYLNKEDAIARAKAMLLTQE